MMFGPKEYQAALERPARLARCRKNGREIG